jgi:hypothetical protein
MPSGSTEAAAFKNLGALAAAQPEEIRTRRTAAEQAYTGVVSRLGAPGTYDLPGAEPSLLGAPAGAIPEGETAPSIFTTEKATGAQATRVSKKKKLGGKEAIQDITRVDPTALQQQVEGSAQFRIMSRLTAEAEQLIAREGPLYDEMMNSLQLPILEGAGAMARENTEALKRAAARGGSARRSALEAVQKIRAQERINSQKVMALSQTRFALDQWARENARTTLEFGQNWASNLGGIRESYNQAMDQASSLMLNSALPIMFQAEQEHAKWRHYAHNKNRAKVGQWVSGIMGVASLAMGGMGALGVGPAALGTGAGGLARTGLELITGATAGPEAPV